LGLVKIVHREIPFETQLWVVILRELSLRFAGDICKIAVKKLSIKHSLELDQDQRAAAPGCAASPWLQG
jgi:hypothetical protein